ncbi:MAG: site-2 protease family protein, partial [Candidatus Eisenbacteria bacterium]|nr:site-2 protease family protein [Candidatus Eisenbacteria bacterium]
TRRHTRYTALSRGLGDVYKRQGIAAMVGMFGSIIFHELCHSLVARRQGMHMGGITLFIFGGVAEMGDEPPNARAEFLMAIAGPLSSVLLAGGFYGLHQLGGSAGWGLPFFGVTAYLAVINLVLAAFNLIPAFPLDGGRVLRAALWGWKKNLRWATRVASRLGSGFAIALIVLGVFQVLMGNFVGGLWWFMIGIFLRNASEVSYRQLLVRRALEGEPVERFMERRPVTVRPELPLDRFVDEYLYRHPYKLYPVLSEDGQLLGSISTDELRAVAREDWPMRRVGMVARAVAPEERIGPGEDATRALAVMHRTHRGRLLVTEGDRLVGLLTLKDLLRFLAIRMELEDEAAPVHAEGEGAHLPMGKHAGQRP